MTVWLLAACLALGALPARVWAQGDSASADAAPAEQPAGQEDLAPPSGSGSADSAPAESAPEGGDAGGAPAAADNTPDAQNTEVKSTDAQPDSDAAPAADDDASGGDYYSADEMAAGAGKTDQPAIEAKPSKAGKAKALKAAKVKGRKAKKMAAAKAKTAVTKADAKKTVAAQAGPPPLPYVPPSPFNP